MMADVCSITDGASRCPPDCAGKRVLAGFLNIFRRDGMNRSKYMALIFGLLLLAALVYAGMNYGELSRFAQLIVNINPIWIVMASLFQVATYFSLALAWYRAFAVNGIAYPLGRLFPLAFAKLFADQALPSAGISGIAFVINAFRQRSVTAPVGMGVMLLTLFSNYFAFAIVAAASFLALWRHHEFHQWTVIVAGLFFVFVVTVPGAILLLKKRGIQNGLPLWLMRLPVIAGVVETFDDAPDDMLRKPGLFFEATLYQSAIFVLDAATLWAMLAALGEPTSFQVAFPAFIVASIVATISLIPLGLGSFELICTGLLVSMGAKVESALTATLLLRGFTVWLPMIPGLLLTRRELR
jgi:uncharacterized protein (TIRG00374 family)